MRIGLTQALKSNRPNGGVTGGLIRNAVRDLATQIPGDKDHFGVRCVSGAGASYTVANPKLRGVAPNCHNRTRGAVAQRLHLGQPRFHFFISRAESLTPERIKNLSDEIRSASSLSEERTLCGFYGGAFGPGADERACGAHQHAAGPERWWRQVFNLQFTGAKILYDLFH